MRQRSLWPLGLALASAASAQTGRLVPTLESLLAPADRAFTGKVVQVVGEPAHDSLEEPGYRQYDLVRYTLTIAVETEIKGKGPKTVTLQFGAQDDRSFWREWIDPQRSYLWSVGGMDSERWGPLAYRTKQSAPANSSPRWIVLDLDRSDDSGDDRGYFTLPVLTSSLDGLRNRSEVLARARAFARSNPARLPVVDVVLPSGYVNRKGIRNFYPVVTFPKNAVTERTARRLIEHPEDFVEKEPSERENIYVSGIIQTREAGIRLLGKFKSDRNARFLETRLRNPYLWYTVPTIQPSLLRRESEVWQKAYETLRAWGIKVDL